MTDAGFFRVSVFIIEYVIAVIIVTPKTSFANSFLLMPTT